MNIQGILGRQKQGAIFDESLPNKNTTKNIDGNNNSPENNSTSAVSFTFSGNNQQIPGPYFTITGGNIVENNN